MSTQLGYFGDDNERDYPDLNKCPDCETFFDGLNCPLCGKVCPEEMRAGNRKPIKIKKKKQNYRDNGRVQFIPWYFSTWFIILMMFVQPIVGLVLIWMGVWKKPIKILATVLLVLPFIGGYLLVGMFGFIDTWMTQASMPDHLELSMEEYVDLCETVDAQTLYRNAEEYADRCVAITLTVEAICADSYGGDYSRYYYCFAETENGQTCYFLIRDFRQDSVKNLLVGDVITVYGEGAGNTEIYNYTAGDLAAPCIDMLHCEILG